LSAGNVTEDWGICVEKVTSCSDEQLGVKWIKNPTNPEYCYSVSSTFNQNDLNSPFTWMRGNTDSGYHTWTEAEAICQVIRLDVFTGGVTT